MSLGTEKTTGEKNVFWGQDQEVKSPNECCNKKPKTESFISVLGVKNATKETNVFWEEVELKR